MANVAKFTKSSIGNMAKHFERGTNSKGQLVKFKNQEIDITKSHLNYNLAKHIPENLTQKDVLYKRLSEVYCLKRADVNVMCSWVVTKPGSIKVEEQDLFFKETYNFLEKEYGKENVISAYVHLDENTPHIHFSFVPVTFDSKHERLKVRASDVINRNHLKQFHPKLEKHLSNVFGREVGVLNDATKDGNKSIEELKKGTAIEKLNTLKKEISKYENDLNKYIKSSDSNLLDKAFLKMSKSGGNLLKKMESNINIQEHDIELLKKANNTLSEEIKSKDKVINELHEENQSKDKIIENLYDKNSDLKVKNIDFAIKTKGIQKKLLKVAEIIKSNPELKENYLEVKKVFELQEKNIDLG